MKPRYSVVVAISESSPWVEFLLRCLEAQQFPPESYECILVAYGVNDDLFRTLKQQSPHLKFRHRLLRHPGGMVSARNRAWKESNGEIIVFLDDDMLPAPEWLQEYDASFERDPADLMAGARYRLPKGVGEDLIELLSRLTTTPPQELFLGDASTQFAKLRKQAEADGSQACESGACSQDPIVWAQWFTSSNMAIRKKALETMGGLNPFLTRTGDLAIAFQIWESGGRFGVSPRAAVYGFSPTKRDNRPADFAEAAALFYRHPYDSIVKINAGQNGKSASIHRVPLPASCIYNKAQLLDYFHENWGVSLDEINGYLDDAVNRGIVRSFEYGEALFDIYHLSNWLKRHTLFKQYELLHTSYARVRKTRYQRTKSLDDLSVAHCAGKYHVRVDFTACPDKMSGARLTIPAPVVNSRQTGVEITDPCPPDLMEYYDSDLGVIYQYPLERLNAPEGDLSYRFECSIQETSMGESGAPSPADGVERSHLQPIYSGSSLAAAKQLLRQMELKAGDDTSTIAHKIYMWILENTSYFETPLPDRFILDTGLGDCMSRSKMFIGMCRIMQIPAREQCGGLLLWDQGEVREGVREVLCKGRGYSPLIHTWAEFFDADRGWVAVEFLGWSYGSRALTPKNVVDPELRREVEADTPLYDQYYFGGLDPFRIHTGEKANLHLTCPVNRIGGGSQPIMEALASTRHTLTAQISVNP